MKKFNATSLFNYLAISRKVYEAALPSIQLTDNLSVSILEKLLPLGISDKTTARPFVVYYVAEKTNTMPYEGQRGITFGYGTNEERRVTRILSKMFDDTAAPKPKANAVNKTDPVAKLVKGYGELTAAQKRRFLASI